MTHKKTNDDVPIEKLAAVLNLSNYVAADLLEAIGVRVDKSAGTYSCDSLHSVLGRFADMRRNEAIITPRLPGRTARSRWEGQREAIDKLREKLVDDFEKAGLECVGSGSRNQAILKFKRANWIYEQKEIVVLTYISTKPNLFGRVSFTVNHLEDETIGWVALVALPINKTYLLKMSTIRERFARTGRSPNSANVTIKENEMESNLFANKIRELLENRDHQ